MAWPTAISDLRMRLSDGSTDRLRAYKRVFGDLNGSNTLYKTFEFRRVTNFTTAAAPYGVYLNGSRIAASGIASDDPSSGYFTLVTAPTDGDVLEATYYIQYFTDSELETFLRLACDFLALGDDYSQIPQGLRAGALYYAVGEAYEKLGQRFTDTQSDTYRLEDMPDDKRIAMLEAFKKTAQEAKSDAIKFRNDYYENRQGQALQPLFGSSLGSVRDVVPNR